MKCKHYKKDGYKYKLDDDQELNLCEQCDMDLLAQMKMQEIYENKWQRLCNADLQNQIDELKKENETKLSDNKS